ncbi:MAG: hypothetical protein ACK46X_12755, partial [Candidatus Sericytochromatia bacterium]
YDGRGDRIKLVGRAELRRLRGATLSDETTGAVITYDNGTEQFAVDGTAGPLSASAPGFATPIVIADEPFDAFHLARNDGLSDPFDQDTIDITGTVTWPSADHQGGVAYYFDEANTWAEPHRIASDNTFGLELTRQGARPARGVVMVLAQNSQNQRLIGVSAPFSPFEGGMPGQIRLAVADQAHAFTVTDAPGGLTSLSSRAEIVVPDGPVVALQGPAAATGTIDLPDAAALPGAMRLVVEAGGTQGNRFSRVVLPIEAGPLSGAFLPLPVAQADPVAGRVSWADLGAGVRYRVEAQQPESPGRAAWEAWIGKGTSVTVGAGAWPGANGRMIVEALDAAIATRQVVGASPRALRAAPWARLPASRVSRDVLTF